ncbi:hypothetical protein [uncultured Sphingomonas sp.]|uniref:hypothetical protein n=1 Tax=uncultured Sphingomonas sp. TaxID=158754 RepID=UPI00261937CA|nr:hypothetical protein [uncultured Sphingomonas sp.]
MAAPNRRQLLTGAAVYAAGAAIVVGGAALTSDACGATADHRLHALIAESRAKDRVVSAHIATLDGLEGEALSREIRRNNDLNDVWVNAMDEVAHHPVTTAADLKTKLAFMLEHHMGDGIDWLQTIAQDVSRIAAQGV